MDPALAEQFNALDSVTLGSRLRAARSAAALTQPQLALDITSVTYLSRIETGLRRPNPATLEALCRRLGVSVEEVVLGFRPPSLSEFELGLDHAELMLTGGDFVGALARVESVWQEPQVQNNGELLHRALFVRAAALDASGDASAAEAYVALLDQPGLELALRVRVATVLSTVLREQGRLEEAIAVASDALAATTVSDLARGEAAIRLSVTLAAALYEIGQVDEARRICERAIADAETLRSPAARAAACWNASVIEAEAGNTARALDLASRALALLESEEGVRDLARLRTQLGTIMLRAEPPLLDDARSQLQQADRELASSGSSLADRARNEIAWARAEFFAADRVAARAHAEHALEAADGLLPLVTVSALLLLGQIAWADADGPAAQARYRSAITVLTGIGADREAAQLWFDLGALLDEADMLGEARDAYRRAAASSGLAIKPSPMPARTEADGQH